MSSYTVTIHQFHREAGKPRQATDCEVALAIAEAVGETAHVLGMVVFVGTRRASIPAKIQAEISAFDNRRTVDYSQLPLIFELELEELDLSRYH